VDAGIALDREKQVTEKYCSAGTRGSDGEILWRVMGQRCSGEAMETAPKFGA